MLVTKIQYPRSRTLFGAAAVSKIPLIGFPYVQELRGVVQDCNSTLDALSHNSDYKDRLRLKVENHIESLAPLFEYGYHGLDAVIKKIEPLSYEEAFSLVGFVCMSSNDFLFDILSPMMKSNFGAIGKDTHLLQAVSLLQGMSTRECILGLAPSEIAGMVAGVLEMDTVTRIESYDQNGVIGLGGMGGDKGLFKEDGISKLFSISTLAAIALSQFSEVHKHHSYPNTSKVAGQSAIEELGARSDFSNKELMSEILGQTGLLMTSCHTIRTIHNISHILKGETINHVIGPLAIPQDSANMLTAFIGVNHNVHPTTIIESLKILHEKGIQNYGNSIAFSGVASSIQEIPTELLNPESYYRNQGAKDLIILDEVPPPPYTTLTSFLVDGENRGVFLISPDDFMTEEEISSLESSCLMVPNTEMNIKKANNDVLYNQDDAKTRYIAMSVALGLFTKNYAHLSDALDPKTHRVNRMYLRDCYQAAYQSMVNGSFETNTLRYVESTQSDPLPGIDLVIFDVDNTLIAPRERDFYRKYSEAVNVAVSKYLEVPLEEGTRIADHYRRISSGGEVALFFGTIPQHFPEYTKSECDTSLLYEEMSKIDPRGEFDVKEAVIQNIKDLRQNGKIVVALTDSPEELSRKCLNEAGFNPDEDFDAYYPYKKDTGPLKILKGSEIFLEIASSFGVEPNRVLSIGDTFRSDIEPAMNLGMHACHITKDGLGRNVGLSTDSILKVPLIYRQSLNHE